MKAETDGSGSVMMSPIELVVEQPINIGCYHTNQGEHETQLSSIQGCLIHCKKFQMRFALMLLGNQCSCLAVIDHDHFEELSPGRCNVPCSDYSVLSCGGPDALSLYTAGWV